MDKITLNAGQQAAVDIMKSGQNVHLYGEGGTGKSVTLKAYIDSLGAARETTIICAPTGIAALNVGGTTLHRTFKIPVRPLGPNDDPPAKVSETLRAADRVIVDEISMCRFDVFNYVSKCIRLAEKEEKKQIQLIVVGDFLQLPPVIGEKDLDPLVKLWGEEFDVGDGFAFQAPTWQSWNFVNCELKEIMRQRGDAAYTDVLNLARQGIKTLAIKTLNNYGWEQKKGKKPPKDAIYLFPHKTEAEKRNKKMAKSKQFLGKTKTFTATVTGKVAASDKPVPDEVDLAPGMRVMSVVNDKYGLYRNGSIGTVRSVDPVIVDFDGGVNNQEIEPYEWTITDYAVETEKTQDGKTRKKLIPHQIGSYTQIPLKLAYAITIHKSQGQTYDAAVIDPGCFCAGQLYVAVSRVKSREGLFLSQEIGDDDFKTNLAALRFYEAIAGGKLETVTDATNDDNEILKPYSIEENVEIAKQQRQAEKAAEKPTKKSKKAEKSAKPAKKQKTDKKQTRENAVISHDSTQVDIKPLAEAATKATKATHGGAREGAGRKSKYEGGTVIMRIPAKCVPIVKMLMDLLAAEN